MKTVNDVISRRSRISRTSRRSQIAMGDLFAAASIFLILLFSVIFIYNHYLSKFETRQEMNSKQIDAFRITELLVKSGGLPSGWENDPHNAVMIGLAGDGLDLRLISEDKLESFMNLSYSQTKDLFRTSHDFYFIITDLNSEVLKEKGI